jgi:hypothetical protein
MTKHPDPPPYERLTYNIWPAPPADYSLETVNERWEGKKAVYHATRIKEPFSAGAKARASIR